MPSAPCCADRPVTGREMGAEEDGCLKVLWLLVLRQLDTLHRFKSCPGSASPSCFPHGFLWALALALLPRGTIEVERVRRRGCRGCGHALRKVS